LKSGAFSRAKLLRVPSHAKNALPQKLIVDSDQSTEKNQWYYHSEKGFCVLFKREN